MEISQFIAEVGIPQGATPPPGPPGPPVGPPIETCPPTESATPLEINRVQRVLNFDQAIHRNIQLQVSGTPPLTLFGYSMEWVPVSVSELRNQRNAYASSWQFNEHGHLFQSYIAYISTADIEWSIVVDGGTPDTYTLPSTDGAFIKRWVILKARKGKLWDWSFACDEEFQIILSQSILLAKEFKTGGPYQQLNCFGDQTGSN